MTSWNGRMVVNVLIQSPSISTHKDKRKSPSSYDIILGDSYHTFDSNLDLSVCFHSKTSTGSLLHQCLNLESDGPSQFLYGFCPLIEPYFRLICFLYDSQLNGARFIWMSEKAHVHYFATHSLSSLLHHNFVGGIYRKYLSLERTLVNFSLSLSSSSSLFYTVKSYSSSLS